MSLTALGSSAFLSGIGGEGTDRLRKSLYVVGGDYAAAVAIMPKPAAGPKDKEEWVAPCNTTGKGEG